VKLSPWKSVPEGALDRWRQAFAAPSPGVDLDLPCPVCGERQLHRYYQVGPRIPPTVPASQFVARGALWEWCSNCRSYEHASALVPAWWHAELPVESGALTAQPDALEEALRQRSPNRDDASAVSEQEEACGAPRVPRGT